MKTLDEYRIELNKIDNQIVDLLNQRLSIVMDVGDYKKAHNLPVYDAEREKKILDRLSEMEKFKGSINYIYPSIFEFARKLEE